MSRSPSIVILRRAFVSRTGNDAGTLPRHSAARHAPGNAGAMAKSMPPAYVEYELYNIQSDPGQMNNLLFGKPGRM